MDHRIRSPRVAGLVFALSLLCTAISGGIVAQDVQPDPERLAPGLAMRVEMRGGAKDDSLASDVRVSRLLALHVPRGETVTPFVRRGPYQLVWEGWLDVPRRDHFVFGVAGAGTFSLALDGEVVLEARGRFAEPQFSDEVRLKKGLRRVVASYQAPLSGQADLRVTWRCRKFGVEPIPPTAWFHDPTAVDGLAAGAARRAGRTLFATRRCAVCHAVAEDAAAMPELAMRGPELGDAGERLEAAWMTRWIRAPRQLRSAARMPHVDLGEDPERTAADLAAWLATRRGSGIAEAPAGDPERGHARFVELGCFACHDFGSADESDAWMPLRDAAAKFRSEAALTAFLRQPGGRDPWIRMPHLHLDETEAADLAAFVLQRSAAGLPADAGAVAGDAARGAQAYAELGCAACHEPGAQPAGAPLSELAASPEAWNRGCVADDSEARGTAPDFGLSNQDRAALRAFADSLPVASLGRVSPPEFATRQIRERRCNTCHEWDGVTSLWTRREARLAEFGLALPGDDEPADLEGHGELLQLRPTLTWVGEKLRQEWTKGFLRGAIPSPRPWLHARMPKLPDAVVDPLVTGLAQQHGFAGDPEPWSADGDLVVRGRGLIEQSGGFGCVTCHAVGDRQPAALFEVQGINFRHIDDRLLPGFYARWMMDPERIEPAAKMPRYADPKGRTALPEFDGDAARQFEAIRHFLRGGSELK